MGSAAEVHGDELAHLLERRLRADPAQDVRRNDAADCMVYVVPRTITFWISLLFGTCGNGHPGHVRGVARELHDAPPVVGVVGVAGGVCDCAFFFRPVRPRSRFMFDTCDVVAVLPPMSAICLDIP